MNRRQALTLIAAAAAMPVLSARGAPLRQTWEGRAMGSPARITLSGVTSERSFTIFQKVEKEIERLENIFSLHRDSALTRLNRDGRLAWPEPEMLEVIEIATSVHAATRGAFDPTIQPLWQALALGRDPAMARALVGWENLSVNEREIRLARPGMALSFNGIAQGYLADRISALLRAEGLRDVLVDMGEIAARGQRPEGGPWRAALADPLGTIKGETDLSDRCLAVSSPRGTLIGPEGAQFHILGPQGQPPRWSLVAITAPSAALADALSTGACLLTRDAIDVALGQFPDVQLAHIS